MEKQTMLDALTQQQARIDEMLAYLPQLAIQARIGGASWQSIGDALGVSRQEAMRRYAPLADPITKKLPPAPEG